MSRFSTSEALLALSGVTYLEWLGVSLLNTFTWSVTFAFSRPSLKPYFLSVISRLAFYERLSCSNSFTDSISFNRFSSFGHITSAYMMVLMNNSSSRARPGFFSRTRILLSIILGDQESHCVSKSSFTTVPSSSRDG